ncbi:hypothetical protein NXF25_010290 [Crotalus adamanteus]|uniref:Uncharacterized protein n=1 Tax=Crotalus adamanteus TaxID=8729 RepID=A0AAW1BIP9_CROAD
MSTVTTEEQALFEAVYILQLIGFSAGATGCILLPITVHHSDWRLWFIEKTSHYMAGVTRVGIWKICFPPNLIESHNYTLRCCHDFELFEKFFPVEMKLGQILMFIGSLFAFWGLLFAFLIPWNSFFQRHIQTRWLPFIGGMFYVLSSICVFIPISWNVYSVFRNENIPFPSSFHLPSRPIAQKNGGAIYLGFMSGVLLFVSGFSIIFQIILMKKITVAFRSIRISPV